MQILFLPEQGNKLKHFIYSGLFISLVFCFYRVGAENVQNPSSDSGPQQADPRLHSFHQSGSDFLFSGSPVFAASDLNQFQNRRSDLDLFWRSGEVLLFFWTSGRRLGSVAWIWFILRLDLRSWIGGLKGSEVTSSRSKCRLYSEGTEGPWSSCAKVLVDPSCLDVFPPSNICLCLFAVDLKAFVFFGSGRCFELWAYSEWDWVEIYFWFIAQSRRFDPQSKTKHLRTSLAAPHNTGWNSTSKPCPVNSRRPQ